MKKYLSRIRISSTIEKDIPTCRIDYETAGMNMDIALSQKYRVELSVEYYY